MSNRRMILWLLVLITGCALLLWAVQRRMRIFPEENKPVSVLFDAPLDQVDRVTVDRGDARVEIRRRNGRWSLYAPFAARVDQGAVARFLDVFETARVTDALSLPELRRRELSLREFGLAPAALRVTFERAQRRDEIRMGAFSPLGKEVYAQLNDVEQVLVLPSEVCRALPRTADDWRSRRLVDCERAQVRGVEIRTPGKPFVKLSKETGTWRLVQPASAPASDDKVDALLDALLSARVERFVWPTVSNVLDVADEAALKTRVELYGLGSDAALQITLQEAVLPLPVRVVFGRTPDDAEAFRYVLLQGGDTIGSVSNDIVRALQVSPADLRDMRLFFERPDAVRRLQVFYNDMLFVLTQTNAFWRMQAPMTDAVDQRVVKDTVEQLLRLKADRIVDAAPGEVAGERTPPLSYVELVSDQGAQRFSIAPESYEGAYYRVAFSNAPTVFIVASSNLPPALVSMTGLLGFRDRTVWAFPVESLRRVTLRRVSGGVETVERSGETVGWQLGEGMSGNVAEPAQLNAWLGQICALRAERVEKLGVTPEDLDAFGLRAPWLEVSVDVESADAVRKTLLVGKEAGFGMRYAMVRGSDVLFVLDKEALDALAFRPVVPL